MNYLIMFVTVVLFMLLVFRLLKSDGHPDFLLKGILNSRSLKLEVSRLAGECVSYDLRGGGIGLSLIKKYLDKAYKVIAIKLKAGENCFDFENRLYDNYYNLSNALKRVRDSGGFYKLPHVNGLPRIYRLTELLVKGLEGNVDAVTVSCAVKNFNDIAPLSFAEICALPVMLDLCLLEYAAIFASKSLKINSNIEKAYRDVRKDRLNLAGIPYNSYIYGYFDYAKDLQKSHLAEFCEDNGLALDARIDNFNVQIARYGGAMQSLCETLLKKDSFITDKFLLELVPADIILRGSESYNKSKISTRYVLLRCLEKRAAKQKISQTAFAALVKERAEREQKDVAELLLPAPKSKNFMRAYIFFNLLIVAGLCTIAAILSSALRIMTGIVFIPIAFGVVLRLVGAFDSFLGRRYLPRKDFAYIDKKASKTLIVYTSLVASAEDVENLYRSLETLKIANPDKIFVYGLLLDLPSASSEVDVKDAKIIDKIKECFAAINNDRYVVFLRKRVRASEKEYRGWERKRGALLDLNKFILKNDSNAFSLVLGDAGEIKYVITLDSDTMINCAVELVEIMEHPYNNDKNIVSLNMKTNPGQIMTPFAALMCGSVGLTNYSEAMTNPNFDIFGSGNYTGKGIYRVEAFDKAVSEAFMDNRLLSHDFIEGAVAGCANADLCGLDYFPPDYSSYLKRKMRWLRGDWQLLPYLFSRVKNRKGDKIKNTLTPIAKWHIMCNIVSSCIPLSSLIFVFVSLFTAKYYFLIVAFSLNFLGILNAIRRTVIQRCFNFKGLLYELTEPMLIPLEAFYSVVAIVATLIRLARGKNLLNWKVFAGTKGRISIIPTLTVSAFILTYNIVLLNSWAFYAVIALFMSGIVFVYCTSKEFKEQKLSAQQNEFLYDVARKTYSYFESMGGAYDNFQEGLGFAKRISPTDIGYMLMAHLCAYRLGFIDYRVCSIRISLLLDYIKKLKKWNGNLYNWYASDGELLCPHYVSTVDNGNFAACLVVLKEELREYGTKINDILNQMKIDKLFDRERGLFYIGFNDSVGAMDAGHYDLLASESMLTYLTAISLNKLDRGCFDKLSRKKVRYKGCTLYSWNGGLFEYLMSDLFLKYPKGTLLYNNAKSAIKSHEKYSKKFNNSFWGMSETLYDSTDDNGWYQYKAFGAEPIAVNGMVAGGVVSPYSSMMALRFDVKKVWANIMKMKSCGMLGEMGFYEACDSGKVIKSYMAHHQGMILMSLTRVLRRESFAKFEASSFCNASQLLISIEDDMRLCPKKMSLPPVRKILAEKSVKVEHVSPPYYNLLSNGKFYSLENGVGKGYLYFDNKYINRYSNDGDGIRIKVSVNGKDEGEIFGHGHATFNRHNSVFEYENSDVRIECEHCVLPYFNGDMRSFKIKNKRNKDLKIAIYVEIELIMTDINKDISHKTFNQMFLHSYYDKEIDAPVFYRTDEEPKLFASVFFDKSANYSGNFEDGDKFGEFPLPLAKASICFLMKPYEETTLRQMLLVSYDLEYLKRSITLTKTSGFDARIKGAVYALRNMNPSFETMARGSLIMWDRGYLPDSLKNILNVDRPVVSFVVGGDKSFSRLSYRLKELSKLMKFGLKFNIVVICKESEGYFKSVSEGVRNIFSSLGLNILPRGCRAAIVDYDDKMSGTIIKHSLCEDFVVHKKIENEILYSGDPYPNARLPKFEPAYKTYKGGFFKDGSFLIESKPPHPWSNVIAEPGFGCVITDTGGGYTFGENSRESKLTAWSNDIMGDKPSESIFFEDDRDFWGATSNPIKKDCDYRTIHRPNESIFYCNYNGMISEVSIMIKGGVKYYKVSILSEFTRNLRVMFAINFVLGDNLLNTANNLEFSYDGGIKAKNLRNGLECRGCCSKAADHTFFRESYCDIGGQPVTARIKNDGIIPYPALSTFIKVNAGEKTTVYFSLGGKPDFGSIENFYLLRDNANFNCKENKISNASFNDNDIFDLKIETGDEELNYLMKWLPHQILNSRFNARAGYYQAGGAIGFRDQLQDCLALLYYDPALVKKHILLCASHQFEKGDVQHWWHFDCMGVRTRIMDDRLYLPLVTAEYINFTGDIKILSEYAPYLNNVNLPENSGDVYASPGYTLVKDSLYVHCIKAIESALDFGENGLLLIKGGDWNDGMNKIGVKNRGTTVWGSMFAFYVIEKFLPFCEEWDKKVFLQAKEELRKGVDEAFNGSWFVRAYADDGSVLGNADCKECKIDLITQAFSVISGIAQADKSQKAMDSAEKFLVDEKHGIIKLLDPPLKNYDAGYISKYPAGVRENGGQYTHGAVWYIWALFESGEYEKAYKMLRMINPVYKCRENGDGEVYKAEPYVIAGDVYAGANAGEGGWSWYTGSAAWYYKCVVEQLLGIKRRGDFITVEPKLPRDFGTVKILYRTKVGVLDILIDGSGDGDFAMKIGKIKYSANSFKIVPELVGKTICLYRK